MKLITRLSRLAGLALLPGIALMPQFASANSISLTDGTRSLTCTMTAVSVGTGGAFSATVDTACFDQVADQGGGDDNPPATYNLSVTHDGTGSGSVTSSPPGINCTLGTCQDTFDNGQVVTLTAEEGEDSTFAGWSGAWCTGPSLTCELTMSGSRSVTATFNGSTAGGSDPGTGLWKPNATTFVHDSGSGTDLLVPRCVPIQYINCRFGGAQSTYDTVKAGEIWSMRVNANIQSGSANNIHVVRAESGEYLTAFDISISSTPGDFNVSNPYCVRIITQGASPSLTLYHPDNDNGRRCVIVPGARYYLNVRPAVGGPGETLCGTSSANACRYKILWTQPL